MKTKILIIAFMLAVIASFSFITIDKDDIAQNGSSATTDNIQSKSMNGFALEDENQF